MAPTSVRSRRLSIIPAGQGRCRARSLDCGWCVEPCEERTAAPRRPARKVERNYQSLTRTSIWTHFLQAFPTRTTKPSPLSTTSADERSPAAASSSPAALPLSARRRSPRYSKRCAPSTPSRPENDPYGEHDFGAFEFDGKTIIWKIDYYDPAFEYHAEDPLIPTRPSASSPSCWPRSTSAHYSLTYSTIWATFISSARSSMRSLPPAASREADREEIIAYVKHIVLESYNNGRAAGRGGGKKPPTDDGRDGRNNGRRRGEAPPMLAGLSLCGICAGRGECGAGSGGCPHPPGGGRGCESSLVEVRWQRKGAAPE